METITLAADTTNRIQALARVRGKNPQVIFDEMLQRGLDAFQQEREGIDIRVKGYAAERIETLAAIYECDNNSMADRLLRLGIDALDAADGAPAD